MIRRIFAVSFLFFVAYCSKKNWRQCLQIDYKCLLIHFFFCLIWLPVLFAIPSFLFFFTLFSTSVPISSSFFLCVWLLEFAFACCLYLFVPFEEKLYFLTPWVVIYLSVSPIGCWVNPSCFLTMVCCYYMKCCRSFKTTGPEQTIQMAMMHAQTAGHWRHRSPH